MHTATHTEFVDMSTHRNGKPGLSTTRLLLLKSFYIMERKMGEKGKSLEHHDSLDNTKAEP